MIERKPLFWIIFTAISFFCLLYFINNFDAKVSLTESEVKDKLAKQISNPVQWVDSMKRLKKYSIKTHIEFGPGKVLSSLAKQNRVEGEFNSVDNLEVFLKLLEEYGS